MLQRSIKTRRLNFVVLINFERFRKSVFFFDSRLQIYRLIFVVVSSETRCIYPAGIATGLQRISFDF